MQSSTHQSSYKFHIKILKVNVPHLTMYVVRVHIEIPNIYHVIGLIYYASIKYEKVLTFLHEDDSVTY
jgi:hypothetical protein